MISLCKDEDRITAALDTAEGSVFIRENIRLYLKAYGTDFDFSQIYLQYSDIGSTTATAVILRYNNNVYALVLENADHAELFAFLCGFSGAEIIADISLSDYFDSCEYCYVFSKTGAEIMKNNPAVKTVESAKIVSELVAKTYDDQSKLDFFLNTAHQIRHDLLTVYGYYSEKQVVSIVSLAALKDNISVITSVYTDEYFRGNGLASKLLSEVCCDASKKYVLLCEEHNVKFYEKCGFTQIATCVRVRL